MKNKKVRTMGICLSVAVITGAAGAASVPAHASSDSVQIRTDHSEDARQLTAETPTIERTKVYDGTTDAKILEMGDIHGFTPGDDVSIEVSAQYQDANAGSGKTIVVTYTLTGDDADKYIAPQSISLVGCSITRKPLTVTGAKATSRAYDETLSVQPDSSSLGTLNASDIEEDDDVSLDTSNVTMTLEDANAGENKPVTVTGYTLTGEDAKNYSLSQPEDVTVTITPASYDISALEQIQWTQTEFEYNGSEQKPEISEESLPENISVEGYTYSEDCVNPGSEKTATATLICTDSNFTLSDGSVSTSWSISPTEPSVEIDYVNETVTISYPENYSEIPGVQTGVSYIASEEATDQEAAESSDEETADQETADQEIVNDGVQLVLDLSSLGLPSSEAAQLRAMLVIQDQETFYSEPISIPARSALSDSIETAAEQVAGSWSATVDSLTCEGWTESDIEIRLVLPDGSTTPWQDSGVFSNLATASHIEQVQLRTKAVEGEQFASEIRTESVDLYVLQDASISVEGELGKAYDGSAASIDSSSYTYNGDGEISVAWYDQDQNPLSEAPTEVGSYYIMISAPQTSQYMAASTDFIPYTISKAQAPEIIWPTASSITYGQSLAESTLTSEDTAGTFSWQDDSIVPSVSDSDSTEYVIVYTPNDTDHYDYSNVSLEHTVTVSVQKAAASIDVSGMTSSYTYSGEPFAVNSGAVLNHSEAELSYSLESVTEPGTYTVTVSAPETDNYLAASADVEITVNKAQAPEIIWPTASSITYGQSLSESTLTEGSAEYGTFAWAEASTRPEAGTSSYEVIFTPSDTENYDWSEAEYRSEISVEVAKKDATITAEDTGKIFSASDPDLTAVTEGILDGDSISYTLSRAEGEVAGTYDIIVEAADNPNYNIKTVNGIFTISSKPLFSMNMTTSCTIGYDQENQKQTVAIALTDGATPLVEGTDYSVSYTEASEDQPASIIVTGLGNYTGEQNYTGFMLDRSNQLCSFNASVILDEETNLVTLSLQTSSNRTETGEEALDQYGDPVYSQHNLSLSREFLDTLSSQGIRQIAFQVKEASLIIPMESLTEDSYLVRLAPMNYEDMTWREYVILDEYVELSSAYRFRITRPANEEEIALAQAQAASAADASQTDPNEEEEILSETDVTGQITGLKVRIPKSEEDKAAEEAGTELAERKVLVVLRNVADFDESRSELSVTSTDDYYETSLEGSGMLCLVQDRPENQ